MDKITHFLSEAGIIIKPENLPFMVEQFISEMNKGLAGITSSLKMIPSYYSIGHLSTKIPVIVIDAGGTRLRTGLLTVDSNKNITVNKYKETALPGLTNRIEKDFFFDAIAAQIEPLKTETDRIGFCFSYPLEQLPNQDGVVVNLTKEIKIENLLGEKVGANLNLSLSRKNIQVKKIAVLNDTIATLLAGINYKKIHHFNSTIGLIVGTGTNMAYNENNSAINKIIQNEGTQIINCESGGFDKLDANEIDASLDKETDNPGFQRLEKAVSGRYLGKLIHLTLKYLSAHKMLPSNLARFIKLIPEMKIEDISEWLTDKNNNHNVFAKTQQSIDFSKTDELILSTVINHIINRSAQIVALGCCAVILKQNLGIKSREPACIIYEGSLIQYFPSYLEKFKHFLKNLLEIHGNPHFKLIHIKNSSLKGSGLAALLTEQ